MSQDQNFEGQLTSLANELREIVEKDRLVGFKKIRLDKVSSTGMPDGNFEQRIEQGMIARLKDILDDNSKLLVKIDVGYLVSDSKTNNGKRVIQITAKLFERGRQVDKKQKEVVDSGDDLTPVLEPIQNEVNNSTDIARLVGVTLNVPDSKDHATRLQSVEDAFENPDFTTVDGSRVRAVGESRYAVELRKRVGGLGQPLPIPPTKLRGMAFAPIAVGDTYEVVLYNYDAQADAVARIEIDGLDAINTFNKDKDSQGKQVKYPGYFVPRAKNGKPGIHVVPGWMHTVNRGKDNVFQFQVDELGKGAASALKTRGTTGVITVSIFDAYEPNETPRGRSFGETKQGQPMKVDYELKPVQVADQPFSVISIRYSRNPAN